MPILLKNMINSIILKIKAKYFIKKINDFQKTKNFDLLLKIKFSKRFYLIFFILFTFVFIVIILFGSFLVFLVVLWGITFLFEASAQFSIIITLIVGIISYFSVSSSSKTQMRNKKDEIFDNTIYILFQYLIELKRGNYNFKIQKSELSYLLMYIPDYALRILQDIQINVQNILKNEDKDSFVLLLNKEIAFLIVYIREYFKLKEPDIHYDEEHEKIILDLIENSSIKIIKK